jgi:hypothetical protein
VCFEAGESQCDDDAGAGGGQRGGGGGDAGSGKVDWTACLAADQGRQRCVAGGVEGTAGISEIRILVDSSAMIRVRDLVLPALEEVADLVDLVCSLPLIRCYPCLPRPALHTHDRNRNSRTFQVMCQMIWSVRDL